MTLDAPQPDDASTQVACPICATRVSADAEHFPFCSKRCRQVDLGRWFNGDYTISRPIEWNDIEEGD